LFAISYPGGLPVLFSLSVSSLLGLGLPDVYISVVIYSTQAFFVTAFLLAASLWLKFPIDAFVLPRMTGLAG